VCTSLKATSYPTINALGCSGYPPALPQGGRDGGVNVSTPRLADCLADMPAPQSLLKWFVSSPRHSGASCKGSLGARRPRARPVGTGVPVRGQALPPVLVPVLPDEVTGFTAPLLLGRLLGASPKPADQRSNSWRSCVLRSLAIPPQEGLLTTERDAFWLAEIAFDFLSQDKSVQSAVAWSQLGEG